MTLSIEILPIVFLKNNSSIVWADTLRKEGNKSNNFPNLNGCVGYALASYLLNVNWVWSWNAIIFCRSFSANGCLVDDELIDESSDDVDEEEDDEADDKKFSFVFGRAYK